jgi:hypothetical protein
VLWIGTAERVSALVEMKHPGVWVMGDLADDDRKYIGKNRWRNAGPCATPAAATQICRNSFTSRNRKTRRSYSEDAESLTQKPTSA